MSDNIQFTPEAVEIMNNLATQIHIQARRRAVKFCLELYEKFEEVRIERGNTATHEDAVKALAIARDYHTRQDMFRKDQIEVPDWLVEPFRRQLLHGCQAAIMSTAKELSTKEDINPA